MTLLTIVQNACNELGISAPSTVIGNADSQVKQLLALSNREGKSLAARNYEGWEELITEATHTTLNQADQGTIESIAPSYKFIIGKTLFNRTTQRPLLGELSPQEWQLLQATPTSNVYDHFRIRGGNLLIDPIPDAGETLAFEYMSELWCESSGGTAQAAWEDDTDVGRLDEELLTLGLIWRWKAMKGFSYKEEFNEYERQVADALVRNTPKPTLSLINSKSQYQPGIFIPTGNWNQ